MVLLAFSIANAFDTVAHVSTMWISDDELCPEWGMITYPFSLCFAACRPSIASTTTTALDGIDEHENGMDTAVEMMDMGSVTPTGDVHDACKNVNVTSSFTLSAEEATDLPSNPIRDILSEAGASSLDNPMVTAAPAVSVPVADKACVDMLH